MGRTLSGKFWRTKVLREHLQRGYYPGWKGICEPSVWSVDASHFTGSGVGAWAILCPTGRLVYGTQRDLNGAPEFRGIIEAVRMCPATGPSVVETDQLAAASILHNGDTVHATKLADTAPHWRELLDLLETRDVTIRWVRGHGRRSNPRMAVVDEASRKAARMLEETFA